MGGLSGVYVIGVPILSIVAAIVLFPLTKLALKRAGSAQRGLSALLAALSLLALAVCWYLVSAFFGFYAGPLALIPLAVLSFFTVYFLYRTLKPGDFRAYRLGLFYKSFIAIVGFIFAALFVLTTFPPSDRQFVSPDGNFKVLVYTGDKCGKTKFKLYTKDDSYLGRAVIDSNCSPNYDGGAYWNADHVALDYYCANGDCYPVFIRLDGKDMTIEDEIRYREAYVTKMREKFGG